MNRKLSTVQQAKLRALSATPDDQIDHTDIPALSGDFWKSAVRNPFYKQTRINAILREEMLKEAGKK